MERILAEFMTLGRRIHDLTVEVEQLRLQRARLEQELVACITGDNNERRVIGRYEARIVYHRRYLFDLPIIRRILEPRRLFDEVAATRIRHEQLTAVIATPGLLTDAEFEDMLGAIHIANVRETVSVKACRSGHLS